MALPIDAGLGSRRRNSVSNLAQNQCQQDLACCWLSRAISLLIIYSL